MSLSRVLPEQGGGLARHQAFLVCGNNPNGDTRPGGIDLVLAAAVAHLVDLDAQPAASLADLGTDGGVVLADATGEDQSIQTTQGGRHGSDYPYEAVDEQRDR